jgi:hypothetical protein
MQAHVSPEILTLQENLFWYKDFCTNPTHAHTHTHTHIPSELYVK